MSYNDAIGCKNFKDDFEDGEVFNISDFVDFVNGNDLTNDDGFGVYSDGYELSDEKVYPSDVAKGDIIWKYTCVVWFDYDD